MRFSPISFGAMRFMVRRALAYWPWIDSVLRSDMNSSSVKDSETIGVSTAAYRARAAVALDADGVFRVEAPAPPLFHHAARQVADLAQALAGKIAEQAHRQAAPRRTTATRTCVAVTAVFSRQ